MNPLLIFLLLFVGIPLVELYFLIQVGSQIGAFATIFLTLLTALIGGAMVRLQGFSTLMRVRGAMERGEVPAIEMMEGAVLLVCGVLLLLPGFVTDFVGFIFLVPQLRRWLISSGLQGAGVMRPVQRKPHSPPGHQRTIEGECRREDDREDD
ncbi:exlusion protein FxsA [Candidatus Endoriftia persephone str. Guaymas]|jgi:UPF0716 protein FxsA|uniref:Cytoplasmic membrane protein n=4 Tax=Gammaproteobacteria TaxID=1236 RepID=G2FJV7_9GAMM|nr:FxsA family protein [Candidatus Endoriftia persephone]MBA1329841.1 exlusion protein FxsA [Candidatus Endoriftia persephone str. Guaymas]EGW52916.1 cytoplasmic membrane protein [endosymbiont of Tevnia jerichonana (vent Tica)]KRT54235.1 Protein affecting phage T7 exclusion by the F plasmid, UPF0716 family [endosymbiont of Ridgeia piscesae]KRT60163.1 UPF0716 protein FxsA [endosymbiont of Ridgeia piscesae]USF87944.1 FxsA family protein [Candidatus Endoriftia persephone]